MYGSQLNTISPFFYPPHQNSTPIVINFSNSIMNIKIKQYEMTFHN